MSQLSTLTNLHLRWSVPTLANLFRITRFSIPQLLPSSSELFDLQLLQSTSQLLDFQFRSYCHPLPNSIFSSTGAAIHFRIIRFSVPQLLPSISEFFSSGSIAVHFQILFSVLELLPSTSKLYFQFQSYCHPLPNCIFSCTGIVVVGIVQVLFMLFWFLLFSVHIVLYLQFLIHSGFNERREPQYTGKTVVCQNRHRYITSM